MRSPGSRVARTVTPWGWTLAAAVLVGLACAWLLRWSEGLVIAVAALGLLVLAVPWVVGERWATTRLGVSAERVPVGAPAVALIEIGRPTRAATPSAVDVRIGGLPHAVDIPPLDVGRQIVRSIPLDTSKRGVLGIGPAVLVRTDPFGVLQRTHRLTETATLVVHPRIVSLPGGVTGIVRDLEGEAASERTADDISFHSLREYQPGDDRRLVHWRSSARHGALLVRQFEPSRRADTLIVLSTDPGEYDGADFELALSIVGTLAAAALAERRRLRVVTSPEEPGGRAPELDAGTRERLLDALAVIEPERTHGIAEAARAARGVSTGSVAWLVTGSAARPRTLRTAANGMPAGVVTVVVRAAAGSVPARVRLGETDVLTIGAVEDLARGIGLGRST